MLLQFQSALGLVVIIGIAWLLSENRRAFPLRTVIVGLALQIGLAALLLNAPGARDVLLSLNVVVVALSDATRAGTSFVFGYVGGGKTPFAISDPASVVSFAFQLLPLVIVMSALSCLLWYWRVLQIIVGGLSWVLRKSLGLGGALGLGAAASVFMGTIEAPLLIRPYLARMSRAELFMLFTVGLATVAGTVFVLYAAILSPVIPAALGHILIASLLSLPAAILLARVMIPDNTSAQTDAGEEAGFRFHSSMDAVARGTEDGLKIWLSIVAMLLVIVALVALADIILSAAPQVAGEPITIERVFGWIFAPFVWLLGIPWKECVTAGALMGDKTILNELIAYQHLAALPADALEPRSRLIMLYGMCGFANLGSLGIMIAGLTGMVPERRAEIVPLVMKGLVSGTLASAMTGAVIGLLPAF